MIESTEPIVTEQVASTGVANQVADERADIANDVAKQMTTTTTDLESLRLRLQSWLTTRLGAPATVAEVTRPVQAGMSNVSLLFDATWIEGGQDHHAQLVARMAPDTDALPVFPAYDLRLQYEVIAAVAAHSDVPVPRLRWIEESGAALGSPFIVMDRIDGRVPVDNPPYVFFGWYFDAPLADQLALQNSTLRLLAQLHAIPDPTSTFPRLAAGVGPDAMRTHVERQREYYEWTRHLDGLRVPVIEDAFAWLEANWPTGTSGAVLSWGDSRIGNVIYRGFEPVAVLDWEMAALAPREVDVAWFIFIHRFFQDIAAMFDQPGLPAVCRRADVIETYEAASGHTVRDLDFYLVYAALRHAVVMSQVKRRMIHFGEDTVPASPDEYVLHHATLRAMIDGNYDWTGK